MMFVLTLAISRVVPILFMVSFFLVFSRFLYDRYHSQNRTIALTFMIIVLTLGLFSIAPFVLRAGCATIAEIYYLKNDWKKTDSYFSLHSQFGGKATGALARDWINALMANHEWQKAEAVILSTFKFQKNSNKVQVDPEFVLLLGISRYYDGRADLARRTLATLSGIEQNKYLADYFLGRIAENQKDFSEASAKYLASANESPRFLPAVYHAVRMNLITGKRAEAEKVLAGFVQRSGSTDSNIQACLQALQTNGSIPPPKEFVLVHIAR